MKWIFRYQVIITVVVLGIALIAILSAFIHLSLDEGAQRALEVTATLCGAFLGFTWAFVLNRRG